MKRLAAMFLLSLVVACGAGGDAGDQGVVVVTTSVLGDVVSNIVGDQLRVEVLIPPGTDPHDFQPSAQQSTLIREAALVVSNGLGLEEGLLDLIEDAEAEGANVLELAGEVDPIPFTDEDHGEEGEEDADEHGHGEGDPHFWQDPVRMAQAVGIIGERLAALEGVDVESIRRQADDYATRIGDLHAEIEALVETLPGDARKMVTNHDAFGYFAARYGFEVIGVVIPGGSTLAEPSSAAMAALVREIQDQGVKAIFTENIDSALLAQTVAAEVGREVAVVQLHSDSLGEQGSAADTYIDMMLSNARAIVGALG